MTEQTIIDARQDQSKSGSGARYNAVTHGLTAKTALLAGEDALALEAKIAQYRSSLQTRNAHEDDLATRAAEASWRLDRSTRAEVARYTRDMMLARKAEALEQQRQAMALGQRLFFDRRGPAQLYPSRTYDYVQPRTSWSEIPDDPDHPARIILELESTLAGVRLLLARWGELRAWLESGGCYHGPQKLAIIRLLGRQPLDAADVQEVAEVFLASHVLWPQHEDPFQELRCEMYEDRYQTYESRLYARDFAATKPPNAEAARAVLLSIVDRATARLQALEAEHEQVARVLEKLQSDVIAFDDNKGGEQLHRLIGNCNRLMDRNFEAIYKGRRYEAQGWGGTKKERERRIAERASRLNVCGSVGPSDQSLVLDEEGKIRPAYGYAGDLEEGLARYKEVVGPQPYPPPDSLRNIDENDIPRVPDYARWKPPAADHEFNTAATMSLTTERDRAKIQNNDDDFDTSWVNEASEAAYGQANGVISDPRQADQKEESEIGGQAEAAISDPHPALDQVVPDEADLSDGAQAIEQDAVATMAFTAEGDTSKSQNEVVQNGWHKVGSGDRPEHGPAAKAPGQEGRRETVEQWVMNRPLLLSPLAGMDAMTPS